MWSWDDGKKVKGRNEDKEDGNCDKYRKTMMRQDTFKDDESSRNHTQPVKNTENYWNANCRDLGKDNYNNV